MLQDYLKSFVEGRVRVRHPALRNPELLQQLRELLAAMPGVQEVTTNDRTGSLLLYYDPKRLDIQSLLDISGPWLDMAVANGGKESEKHERSVPSRKAVQHAKNIAMLFGLGTALASGLAGVKQLHALSSLLFALCTTDHVLRHRKSL